MPRYEVLSAFRLSPSLDVYEGEVVELDEREARPFVQQSRLRLATDDAPQITTTFNTEAPVQNRDPQPRQMARRR